MKTQSKLLFLTGILSVVAMGLLSCGSKDKTPKPPEPGNVNQEYITTYRIALSDGRIFEGESNNYSGQLCRNEGDEEYIPIVAYGIGGKKDNQLQAHIFFVGGELQPLGSEGKNYSETSMIGLNFFDLKEYYKTVPPESSIPVTGNHSISNFQKHNYITSSSGIDKATLRYDFNDVVLYEAVTGEKLTASGYIRCVVR